MNAQMPERLNAFLMAYLSLYRKYRSQSFEDLAGQEHVTRTLQNALRGGRVAHAYLFSGPRGTGKTSAARLLARALNCETGPTPTPCGECGSCREIRDGISPTVVEIDAASSRGIDEVRELRQRAMTVPTQPGARKIFIVDEVHMLTTEACNALLKTLEEPPAHVLFILATTDAQKLPATILSRCQRFEFRRGSVGLIGERIRHVAEAEGYSIEPEAVRLVARASGGSWRDAISLLEQVLSYDGTEISAGTVASVLGAVPEESLFELAEGLARAEGRAVYPIVEQLISAGTEPRQLARDLGEHFRALLMADAGALPADGYSPDTTRRLVEQAARFGTARLVTALEALAQADKEMRWSDSGRVVLEVALARLMLAPGETGHPLPVGRGPEKQPAADRVADGRAPARREPAIRLSEREPAARAMDGHRPPGTEARGTASAEPPAAPMPAAEPRSDPPGLDPFEDTELPALGSKTPATGTRPAIEDSPPTPNSQLPTPSISLNQVRERWNVVVEELRRKGSKPAAALLDHAQPVGCDGRVVVLGFSKEILRDLWERGDHKQRLATALLAVFGQALQVRTEVIANQPGGASGAGTGPTEGGPRSVEKQQPVRDERPEPAAISLPADRTRPAASDSMEGEALLHEVISLFEGQIVDQTTDD
jgi:DNA polymerase-3 subunit gamma/tau